MNAALVGLGVRDIDDDVTTTEIRSHEGAKYHEGGIEIGNLRLGSGELKKGIG